MGWHTFSDAPRRTQITETMSYVIDIITKSSKQQPDESRVAAVPRYWSVSTIDAPITNDGVTVNLTAVLPVRITFYSRVVANATVSSSIRG